MPFTASNTDAPTIAACRVPGGPGTAAFVCACTIVVFQSVTASAEAAPGAPGAARAATRISRADPPPRRPAVRRAPQVPEAANEERLMPGPPFGSGWTTLRLGGFAT